MSASLMVVYYSYIAGGIQFVVIMLVYVFITELMTATWEMTCYYSGIMR